MWKVEHSQQETNVHVPLAIGSSYIGQSLAICVPPLEQAL